MAFGLMGRTVWLESFREPNQPKPRKSCNVRRTASCAMRHFLGILTRCRAKPRPGANGTKGNSGPTCKSVGPPGSMCKPPSNLVPAGIIPRPYLRAITPREVTKTTAARLSASTAAFCSSWSGKFRRSFDELRNRYRRRSSVGFWKRVASDGNIFLKG